MLTVLRVKNFILMDELELTLDAGLNVLTGETGAGKSIVVGALNLVLGGRASADHVRPGSEEAEIEALFELDGVDDRRSPMLRRLAESGTLVRGELLVRRVVGASGRSRAYVNGRLVTAAELAELGPELADVASQHESVRLSDPSTHLEHLDRFAGLDESRIALSADVEELEQRARTIEELRALERSRSEREAFLRFQLQAIDEVAPQPGEIDELTNERRKLRHVGRLVELVQRAATRLGDEDGLCDQLARVASDLRTASELDDTLAPLATAVDAAYSELSNVGAEASRYAEETDVDPGRLQLVEERLYRLEGLARQHGPAIEDVIAARDRIAAELEALTSAEARLESEEAALRERLPAVAGRALELSRARRAAADRLGAAIGSELGSLGMGGARVLVEVEPTIAREASSTLSVPATLLPGLALGAIADSKSVRLGREGIDRVEFLISPNKGLDPKPLRKIASGGELSRALLALKRVLAGSGPAGLYVFDEVDSGVGGAIAERIGSAIAEVAGHHQVLCITHLAPIAAFARSHFVVEKSAAGDVTKSKIRRVDSADREREVARMLSGSKISAAAIEAAREMIAASAPAVSVRKGSAGEGSAGEASAREASAREASAPVAPAGARGRRTPRSS